MGNWSKYQTGKPDVTDEYQSSIDLIADRIDNNADGLNGDDSLTSIDINGGTIDGTPIGANSESTGNFSTVTASSATINNLTISSSATINNLTISDSVTFTNGALGAWDISSYSTNTIYQASSDGFVNAYYFREYGSDIRISGITDSSDSPTQTISTQEVSFADTGGVNVMFPVRNGDYWKVTTSGGWGTETSAVNWIPLGS